MCVRGEPPCIFALEVSIHVFVCLRGAVMYVCVRSEQPCICVLEESGLVSVC